MATNKSKLYLNKRVFEFLRQNPEERFSTAEIAQWIFENYTEECREKQVNSKAKVTRLDNDKALINKISGEISAHKDRIIKNHPDIKFEQDDGLKFYYTETEYDIESKQIELETEEKPVKFIANSIDASTPKKPDTTAGTNTPTPLLEEDLYPILHEYLKSGYPTVYAKHINDKESTKNEGANAHQWRHPDLVGVEKSGADWGDDVRECVRAYTGEKPELKMWSFEVKNEIKKAESRQCFFQAVSNSTWANYGYLVARKIHASAMDDLFILSSLHGIGLIRLDVDNAENSQIVIPAKERTEIDWNTVDVLVKINPDFKAYIKNIRRFYQNDWDDSYWSRLKEPR